MSTHDQTTPAPSADGALSGLAANPTDVLTNGRSIPQPDVIDLSAAELAAFSSGDGAPADAAPGSWAAKDPRSAADSAFRFDVAAVLCGHDVTSVAGREAARHDHHVWDLVEEMTP